MHVRREKGICLFSTYSFESLHTYLVLIAELGIEDKMVRSQAQPVFEVH